jgi:hypothetical protein
LQYFSEEQQGWDNITYEEIIAKCKEVIK